MINRTIRLIRMRNQRVTHNCESTGVIKYWLGRTLLTLMGWQVKGEVAPGKKFVFIGAPHTSNWDFPIGLAATYVYRVRICWMGKQSLFTPPFGGLMRWLGGIAINRAHPNGVVGQLSQALQAAERLVLLITPSGTRSQRPYWKSGFYWIAYNAQVPILCGYLDYKNKIACIGLCLTPTGNVKQDMDRIRAFYHNIGGRHPEVKTRILLKEEED